MPKKIIKLADIIVANEIHTGATKDKPQGTVLGIPGMVFIGVDTGDGKGALQVLVTPGANTVGYLAVVSNLRPITNDDDPWLRINNASGGSDYRYAGSGINDNGTVLNGASVGAAQIFLAHPSPDRSVGDAAGEGFNAYIFISNSNGTSQTRGTANVVFEDANGRTCEFHFAFTYQSTNALTSIDILFGGSNVETGTLHVFEMQKT